MQDSASFWTDIKNLEDQLASSPESFCFARLADIYLKMGLVEDALHVARSGVTKHPGYLAGLRALSLACHAKGLNGEAMASLRLVTEALPEDIPSQKLYGRLLAEKGDLDAASHVFRNALEFAPDDVECRIELESLERLSGEAEDYLEQDEDDEAVIEDLEILEDIEIIEEDLFEPESQYQTAPFEPVTPPSLHHDPLSTGTLAELYVSQGFIHKALAIYYDVQSENPLDQTIAERIVELEAMEPNLAETDSDIYDSIDEEVGFEPAYRPVSEAFSEETGVEELEESDEKPAFESQCVSAEISGHDFGVPVVLSHGVADNALSTLDVWLENIRRIKLCR